MILNAFVEKLKRRSKDDLMGRHFEAALILQAVPWYLRWRCHVVEFREDERAPRRVSGRDIRRVPPRLERLRSERAVTAGRDKVTRNGEGVVGGCMH